MRSKKVAIVQSNYIPWKGYFDLINMVDEFILLDDVQYTRRDWRNRNKIKVPQGTMWLSIPVDTKGKYHQSIRDTQVKDLDWRDKHWKSIVHSYARAPFFDVYKQPFETLYQELNDGFLSQINHKFLTLICDILGIETKLSWSTDYELVEGPTERLVHLCKQAGATHYLSGPAAQSYLDESLFQQEQLSVEYMDYSGYPEYAQLYPPFEHGVTVLDLIFSEGPQALLYMKSF